MDALLELTSRAETSHFWFRGFRRFVTPFLDRAAEGRTDLSVLDCGCGTGHNLGLLARYGSVVGIDLTAAGLTLARLRGRTVARADATRLPFQSKQFDLVTSFDVLQCVTDDIGAVREAARVLRPGGRLVGTVAALELLHGDHSVLSREVRRYSRSSVTRLLAEAGVEPVAIQYAFGSILPLLLVVRAVQRLRGARADGRELTVPSRPVNWLLDRLVEAEASVAMHAPTPLGTSLLFFARK